MKRLPQMTTAEKTIRRISALRDLARRLAQAGYEAGLHGNNPNGVPNLKVAESPGKYTTRKNSAD